MKHRFTLMALATALAACNLVASQANTVAATANNAVLILEPAPCGGIEVVVFYDIINIDEHINVSNSLTASSNMFISISGQSVVPAISLAEAANSHLSAALASLPTINPENAPRKVAIVYRTTAANTIADAAGFGAPRKFPSKVPVPAGFSANPSLSNMTWSLATETALMSPAAG